MLTQNALDQPLVERTIVSQNLDTLVGEVVQTVARIAQVREYKSHLTFKDNRIRCILTRMKFVKLTIFQL